MHRWLLIEEMSTDLTLRTALRAAATSLQALAAGLGGIRRQPRCGNEDQGGGGETMKRRTKTLNKTRCACYRLNTQPLK